MAGGTWIDQNKVRPGVYINYKSSPASLATMGERGVVAIARKLNWGEKGKFYTIEDVSDCAKLGYSITDDEMLFIRQILLGTNRTNGAKKILVWSLDTTTGAAVAASKTFTATGSITVTAKQAGDGGNHLAFEVIPGGSGSSFTLYRDNEMLGTASNSVAGGGTVEQLIEAIEAVPAISSIVTVTGSGYLQMGSAKNFLAGGKDAGANKATVTIGNLTATALYDGTYGNRLSLVITASTGSNFIVQTLLDGQVVDNQISANVAGLSDNAYIHFTGSGVLTASTGASLTGGTNGDITSTAYSDFLSALEVEKFDVVIYDGTEATLKSQFAQYVKRLSNDEGVKCQAVISDYASADSECVISVYPQSLKLIDGTQLSANELTWWVGGATAGANAYESLTYAAHPNGADISPKLTSSQQDAAITAGQFVLISQFEKIQVLTDINSFTTFSVEKGKQFRKNRLIRTIFGLCNDIYKTFAMYYIGAVHNDAEGRKALKGEILNLMNRYQGNRALQNVVADDVTVMQGADSDAVVIEIYCQPVDSIEKIYVNVTIA